MKTIENHEIFCKRQTLNQSALRKRALAGASASLDPSAYGPEAIRDAVGEAKCPPLPSGRTDDLTRWILRMQAPFSCNLDHYFKLFSYIFNCLIILDPISSFSKESLTNQKAEKGRSGGLSDLYIYRARWSVARLRLWHWTLCAEVLRARDSGQLHMDVCEASYGRRWSRWS